MPIIEFNNQPVYLRKATVAELMEIIEVQFRQQEKYTLELIEKNILVGSEKVNALGALVATRGSGDLMIAYTANPANCINLLSKVLPPEVPVEKLNLTNNEIREVVLQILNIIKAETDQKKT